MSNELEVFRLPCGEEVKTGLLLPTAGETLPCAEFPESRLLDKKDIQRALAEDFYKQERDRFSKWMINQSTVGKCNTSANVGGFYQVMDNAGMKHHPLADNHLYWRANGGSDSGSSLARTFQLVQQGGICRRTIEVNGQSYRIPDLTYNTRQLPAGVAAAADADGKRFMAIEAFKVPKDYARFKITIATALALRLPIVWAWHVGAGGMSLRNGFMVCGRGPGNHANVLQSAKWIGGEDLVHPDNRNSWGPSKNAIYGPTGSGWGEDGYGLVTMQDCYSCINYHDFYVITSVLLDPKAAVL